MPEDEVRPVAQRRRRGHVGHDRNGCFADVAVFVAVGVGMLQRLQTAGIGVPADGTGKREGAVLRAGNLPERLLPDVVAALSGGGGHAVRRGPTEQLPRQLRIIDKDVPVALDLLDQVVPLHFPGVHRVQRAPLQQRIQAFDHAQAVVGGIVLIHRGEVRRRRIGIEIRLQPAAVDVQQDAGHVALHVVLALKQVVRLHHPVQRIAADRAGVVSAGIGPVHVAEQVVGFRHVDGFRRGAQVVQIRPAEGLGVGRAAFRPDVLAVEPDALVRGRQIGIEHHVGIAVRYGIRRRPVIRQRALLIAAVGRIERVRIRHQAVQRVKQRVVPHGGGAVGNVRRAGKGAERLVAVCARVIRLRLGGERMADRVAWLVVGRRQGRRGRRRGRSR